MRGRVVDLDTGRLVRKVIWLDEEARELEAYVVDATGKEVIACDDSGNLAFRTVHLRGRFKLLPPTADPSATSINIRRIVMGAPSCIKCGNWLTLQGDDLCVKCRAADRLQKNRMTVERMSSPILNSRCASYGCARLAEWAVGDEVEVTPEKSGRMLYDRGATVGQRFYCSFHYKPPRLLDSKGEVIADINLGSRPQ